MIAGDPVNLHAVFSRAAGENLSETLLSADQTLNADADRRLHLVATVPNTRALV